MGHIVRIKNRKQFIRALRVLNELPGTWHSRASEAGPVLLVLDAHFEALVRAGVVPPYGKKKKLRGKKVSVENRLLEYSPKLKALIYVADEGGFWAKVPSIPGCVSVGDTPDEVKLNILDTLEVCLATNEEVGRKEGKVIEEMIV